MSTNQKYLCDRSSITTVCPYLQPKVAGVVLDRNNYRLDIYISPDYLKYDKQKEGYIAYRSPSSEDWAYTGRFSSNLIGNTNQTYADVLHDQYWSRGRFNAHLGMRFDHGVNYDFFDDDEDDSDYEGGFHLNYLDFNYVKDRRQYMAGFFPARGTFFTVG